MNEIALQLLINICRLLEPCTPLPCRTWVPSLSAYRLTISWAGDCILTAWTVGVGVITGAVRRKDVVVAAIGARADWCGTIKNVTVITWDGEYGRGDPKPNGNRQ